MTAVVESVALHQRLRGSRTRKRTRKSSTTQGEEAPAVRPHRDLVAYLCTPVVARSLRAAVAAGLRSPGVVQICTLRAGIRLSRGSCAEPPDQQQLNPVTVAVTSL